MHQGGHNDAEDERDDDNREAPVMAEIVEEKDGVYTVSAEVFGKGVDMWLRSQGEKITDVLLR